ncbi:CPBP family intramembrane glutamic endopeptidase [Rossellomorea vietnamensis]|uniref:CPBP family intramembrane glutamic endopeptidase n=1 Tax=Rossellomorea vietnamensis TaxID=218284 RepID=UPI001E428069|nr:CPBP family intramembrane glutamic endopeptidase [Rossellomorea vietnamensis]MCC5800360.1 CPBP family intramembrane metalloprotease [Rossellomorea vietnamensis]
MKKQGEIIQQLSKKQLTFHLYFTQFLLLTIACVLGIFLFDTTSEFWNQIRFSPAIFTVGMSSGLLIVLIDILLMKVLPAKYYDDGGVNAKIFTNRSMGEIALLAMFISVSEEVLFRGVLQFHFGLIISSIIFALVHFRYWAHWFLIINIVLLSFWIGFIYEFTDNLLVTIIMHFVIDFLLGLHMRKNGRQRSKEGMSHE